MFTNSTASILRRQRILSNMKPEFPRRRFARTLRETSQYLEALEKFNNPPIRGRPSFFLLADRHQIKFDFFQ
jgi:hypothetical protein